MDQCLDFVYDRFCIGFYPEDGIAFGSHPMVPQKMLSADEVNISEEHLYLSVGNYPTNTGKQICANDSAEEITTSAKESKDGEVFEVNLHFEFKNPTKNSVSLCEALDWKPYHVVLSYMDYTGKVAVRRIIRNGVGQSRVAVTESQGVVSVDVTIRNTNGIQMVG